MTYESVKAVESAIAPGVRYTVAKMSFARRVELMRTSSSRILAWHSGQTVRREYVAGQIIIRLPELRGPIYPMPSSLLSPESE